MNDRRTVLAECPLCGHIPARHWTRQGSWQVVRCQGCGLLMTWPRPAPDVLDRLYDLDGYYSSRAMGEAARSEWAARAQGILAALPQMPGRVLDVGAGAGHFVQAVRELGLQAEGVEPSAAGRQAARRMYGLDLLAEMPDRPHSYDLVSLVHALEHMPDPLARLAGMRHLLSPDHGALFIEVPHAGSVEMWTGRRAEILDLPAHLFHFVPQTLTPLVTAAGLHVDRVGLSNPSFLEAGLGLWARMSPRRRPTLMAHDPRPPGRVAFAKARLLESVRGAFPGWKFLVVATVRH